MEVVIEPKRRLRNELRELWQRRELLYFFAWREVRVRYKQTLLGVAWALIQPLVLMGIFTVFFHGVIGVESGDVPYALFAYTGLIYWYFFANGLNATSQSLVMNQAIITKIYFPRLMPTLSASAVPAVDLLCSSFVLGGLLAYYRVLPSSQIWLLFPMLAVLFLTVWGLGMFLAALNVRYRDVQHTVPFFVQTVFFLTPVIYPISILPERLQWLLYLNPLTGVISALRTGLLGYEEVEWLLLGISTLSALVLLVGGLAFFKSQERQMADII